MNEKEAYLVIDIGTGNARVAVCSVTGEMLGVASADMPYQKDHHYPESIYFDPQGLWELITQLTRQALAECGAVNILAVSSTSQREGIVLIGRSGQSLIGLPNIDHRGREWEKDLRSDQKDRIYALAGRYPTSLFSAMKLVGIRERRQEIWNELETFTSISDWVTYMLSGHCVYEHSQASETLVYDVAQQSWSDELLSIFGLHHGLLPALSVSGAILGKVKAEEASRLGIITEAQVIVGGADTQLGIESTCPESGDVVIVSGTTTPIVQVSETYLTDEKQRLWTGRHTDNQHYVIEANAGVTGLNYQRLKEVFYPNESYDVIEKELEAAGSCNCVAALGSLIADESSPLIRAGFIFDVPVSHLLSRADFVRATLWDMACSIKENYDVLHAISPHEKDYVWACGGGMQSAALRRILANLLGKKILVRSNARQASVAGAAAICNRALSRPQPVPETADTILPVVDEQQTLAYQQWKSTRQTLKSVSL